MKHSESICEIATALAKAQGELTPAKKNALNPYFNASYADIQSNLDAIQEPFREHGLAIVQAPSTTWAEDGSLTIELTTRILHTSGEWIESTLSSRPRDDGPQAIGSVITYLRRYALTAMVRLATEDNDGISAQPRKPKVPKMGRKRQKPQAIDPVGKASKELAAEIMKRTKGDADEARSLLLEITSWDEHPDGYNTFNAFQSVEETEKAWVKLEEHPVYGSEGKNK